MCEGGRDGIVPGPRILAGGRPITAPRWNEARLARELGQHLWNTCKLFGYQLGALLLAAADLQDGLILLQRASAANLWHTPLVVKFLAF